MSSMYQHRRLGGEDVVELLPRSDPRDVDREWPCRPRAVAATGGRYVFALSHAVPLPEPPPDYYPRVCVDYRLGAHEIMLYPQMWNSRAPHMAWIERVTLHRNLHQDNIVGYVFQPEDWEPIYPTAAYGRVAPSLLNRLQEAFSEIHMHVVPLMHAAKTRLLLPTSTVTDCVRLLADLQLLTATYRESAILVTRVQRGIAELRAFRLFRLDVKYRVGDPSFVSHVLFALVGVFTTNKGMAELLHRLGVPVWYLSTMVPDYLRHGLIRPADSCARMVELKPLDSLDDFGTDSRGLRYTRSLSPPVEEGSAAAWPPRSDVGPRARSASRLPHMPSRRRGRSRSPRRGPLAGSQSVTGRRRSPAPSVLPGYVNHGQSRVADDARARQHPDAPLAWVPRSWATDPGRQTSAALSMPDWVPKVPPWLSTILQSVDQTITREFRLCAPDTIHPVPQHRFSDPLLYTLPPLHLVLKHEKRLQYVLRAWVALRDFWLRRIQREGFCGLPAATWRKVLDDKYHIDPKLAAWIEQHYRSSESSNAARGARSAQSVDMPGPEIRTAPPVTAGAPHPAPLPISHSGAYTRAPIYGEELIIATHRDSVEPENWIDQAPGCDIFYERRPRCMSRADSSFCRSSLEGDWGEFWDYENRRILLFPKSSLLFSEAPVLDGGEILLQEHALSWHLSAADEDGLAAASRAMWTARVPLAETVSDNASLAETGLNTVHETVLVQVPPLPSGIAPDPVYGCEPELPNGQAAKTFVVRQQRLSAEDLTRPAVRAFLIWELQETMFRFQLRDLDTYILTTLGLWSPSLQQERETLWLNCWGAQDGFIPTGKKCPLLTHPSVEERKWGVYNFWKLIRAWPRCREVPNLRNYTATDGLSLDALQSIEHEVWRFYSQSFLDYFGLLPTLPTIMPPNPFEPAVTVG